MANDLRSRIWALDTAGAADLHPTGPVFIEQIEFAGYQAATDHCTLTDRNGHLVWIGDGMTDLSTQRSGRVPPTDGLVLSVLVTTGGKVLVYTR